MSYIEYEKLTPILDEEYRFESISFGSSLKFNEQMGVYVKHENENPTGSHKDRSLIFQISYHVSRGTNEFVISSSGNS